MNPLDSTVLTGTYMLTGNNSLVLNGVMNDTLVRAVYRKLPVDGYDWRW
jgi:hypothetical protein